MPIEEKKEGDLKEKNVRERPFRDFVKLSVRKRDLALEYANKIASVLGWTITRVIDDAEAGHTMVFLSKRRRVNEERTTTH